MTKQLTTRLINNDDSSTDEQQVFRRINHCEQIEAGQYWTAVTDVATQSSYAKIKENMTLLITKIRYVENSIHSIELASHPKYDSSTIHELLLPDFMEKFRFEPNGEQVRAREIAKIQNNLQEKQNAFNELQYNPQKMQTEVYNKIELLHPDIDISRHHNTQLLSLGQIISSKELVSKQTVEDLKALAKLQSIIAEETSKLIQSKTQELSAIINSLTPFFKERGLAALAKTSEMSEQIKKITQGINTLDLYTGDGVEVINVIADGKPAPIDEPLVIYQKKLFIDEELCLWADLDSRFDVNSFDIFVEALSKNPEFLDQIIPASRGVCIMATTAREIAYNYDLFTNATLRQRNKEIYIVVRNGENIHLVYAPLHSFSNRLYPTTEEPDNIFKFKRFNGTDEADITFDSLDYPKAYSEYEYHIVHYKRFLVLLCGLDHRLQLLGRFYHGDDNLKFLTIEFQEKYFRFISNDDAKRSLAGGVVHEDVTVLINNQNRLIQKGSIIYCDWTFLENKDNAPALFKESYKYNYTNKIASFVNEIDNIQIVEKDKQGFYVKAASRNESTGRSFDAKVYLSNVDDAFNYERLPFINLDGLSIHEVNYYLHNRPSRKNQLYFIRMFKKIREYLIKNQQKDSGTITWLRETILASGAVRNIDNVDNYISIAIAKWKTFNALEVLPPQKAPSLNSIFDVVYLLDRQKSIISKLECIIETCVYSPLKISIVADGSIALYVEPTSDEMDDRLEKHPWVKRFIFKFSASGQLVNSTSSLILLDELNNIENTIQSWENCKNWDKLRSLYFNSYQQKSKLFSKVDSVFAATLNKLEIARADENKIEDLLNDYIRIRNKLSDGKYVNLPNLYIPFGITNLHGLYIMAICIHNPFNYLLKYTSNESAIAEFKHKFTKLYQNPSTALNFLSNDYYFELVSLSVQEFNKSSDLFLSNHDHRLTNYQAVTNNIDLGLQNWINQDSKGKYWISEQVQVNKSINLNSVIDCCSGSVTNQKSYFIYHVKSPNIVDGYEICEFFHVPDKELVNNVPLITDNLDIAEQYIKDETSSGWFVNRSEEYKKIDNVENNSTILKAWYKYKQ